MIQTFAAVSGRPIPYRISARRDGDIPSYYADPGEARRRLGWTTQRTLEDICRDSWRWQQNNPQGYPDEPA
jgi:UDP-glucose 4-epimerase